MRLAFFWIELGDGKKRGPPALELSRTPEFPRLLLCVEESGEVKEGKLHYCVASKIEFVLPAVIASLNAPSVKVDFHSTCK